MQERQVESETIIEQLRQAEAALTQWVSQALTEPHQHQTEDELIKANRLESVAVLAGGIAHDFNNMLTAILGNVSLAKMRAPQDDDLIKRLSNAEKATLRAQDLTRQLLTMTQDSKSVKQLASIREVVQEAIDFSLRGSNVRYELSMPTGLWPVEMDTGQISQVMHNLIINADHAMPEGGVIRVHARNIRIDDPLPDLGPANLRTLSPGPYVNIVIRDQGIGIDAAHLRNIFAPYFTTKAHGNGLGLATAYVIVKKHQGIIYAESEVDVGTTFHLYLPASPARHVMAQSDIAPPIASSAGRILIMEDDETLHDVIGSILDMLGYKVVFTRDGHETLAIYQQARAAGSPFDAVILDLTIPGGMGGRQTLSELLVIDPQVKAIVVSGYATDPILVQCQRYGFCGGIAKPYRAQQLHQVLCEVIQAPAPTATPSPVTPA
jgi:signal transduction histidine kinase/ActR/RegA family two-component response regulator